MNPIYYFYLFDEWAPQTREPCCWPPKTQGPDVCVRAVRSGSAVANAAPQRAVVMGGGN